MYCTNNYDKNIVIFGHIYFFILKEEQDIYEGSTSF